MDLQNKQIVKLRSGNIGVVVGWGEKPAYVVTATFVNTLDKWGEDGKRKNAKETPNKYDIMAVYDGSATENPTDVFKASFKVEEQPLVWAVED